MDPTGYKQVPKVRMGVFGVQWCPIWGAYGCLWRPRCPLGGTFGLLLGCLGPPIQMPSHLAFEFGPPVHMPSHLAFDPVGTLSRRGTHNVHVMVSIVPNGPYDWPFGLPLGSIRGTHSASLSLLRSIRCPSGPMLP